MVKIKLQKNKKKKAPFYHVVVADSRSPRDGKIIEKVGTYNPMTEPATIEINKEKVAEWVKNGAKPTDTVKKLIEVASKEFYASEVLLMEDILEVVIKNLVDNKDEVSINEKTNDNKSICYEVKVDRADMGKVIGKQGKMAKSIRTIMKAIAGKEHKRVTIEFLD